MTQSGPIAVTGLGCICALGRDLDTCFAGLFLGYVASQAGWVVAEVGRQPWAIQGLLPVGVASTRLNVGHVQATFFIFLTLFTALLIAEIGIMVKQIKIGPEE